MADRFKRVMHLHVGPGGVNCPCCGYGKTKDRRKFYTRFARRVLKHELINDIENEIHQDNIDENND